MNRTPDYQFGFPGARYWKALAGTIFLTQLGLTAFAWGEFSASNCARVWREEFGSPLAHTTSEFKSVPSLGNLPGSAYSPTAHLTSNQPHPAVVRVIVPEDGATSFGSGTLIDVREKFGLVITNWHVVRDAKGPIEVVFPGGFTSQARALKVDSDWDLAALVIWEPPVEPVTLAEAAPRPGEQLTICGYGPGIYRSATGRCTQYYSPQVGLPQQMVELDVEARQGDSGGPIFNHRGELAGVLFGAGQGTTLGSFGGRVDSFLASLAPDIGIPGENREPPAQLAAQNNPVKHSPRENQATANPFSTQTAGYSSPTKENSGASVPSHWQSNPTQLLEAPDVNAAVECSQTAAKPQASFAPVSERSGLSHAVLFEKAKTTLAMVGLLSLALLVIKAAG